jgi:sortase A
MTSTIARPQLPPIDDPDRGRTERNERETTGEPLAERFLRSMNGERGAQGVVVDESGPPNDEDRAAAIGRAAIAAYRQGGHRLGLPPLPDGSVEGSRPPPRPVPELVTAGTPVHRPLAVPESPVDSSREAIPSTLERPSRRVHAARSSSIRHWVIPVGLPIRSPRRSTQSDDPSTLPVPATRTGGLSDAQRHQLVSASNWVRNIGALLILFAAWQLWGTAIAQHHAQSSLQSQFETKVKAAPSKPTSTLVPASVQYPLPPEGTVMAHLQIPAINLDQYVVSGTASDDLAKGPGHYIGTAMPGQAGNVAIAGHRTTHGAPFNRLAELAVGDPIYLTTVAGQRLTYIVAHTPYPVVPTNTSVLNYFGDDRLTLTTCNPEFSATQRLIVVAEYLQPGAATHPPLAKGRGTPVSVEASGEAGWDVGLIPLVLIELGLLAALAVFNGRLARLFGREGRWLILVPIWMALIFALFQSLTSFLPAAA